ncbi:MAG: hypothetical protein SGCHY_005281, partial [Lobulomycetales sp.]
MLVQVLVHSAPVTPEAGQTEKASATPATNPHSFDECRRRVEQEHRGKPLASAPAGEYACAQKREVALCCEEAYLFDQWARGTLTDKTAIALLRKNYRETTEMLWSCYGPVESD